jgi:outer membrane protein OmpA-like peptidoglycan-associated protein
MGIKLFFIAALLAFLSCQFKQDNTSTQLENKEEPDSLNPSQYYYKLYSYPNALDKITDNFGNGNDSLYGTRNMRPIIHGLLYRGGANNYYHKTAKRDNHNPLPPDGKENLCSNGFGRAIYLYRANFEEENELRCSCMGEQNSFRYDQYDYNDSLHIRKMLELVKEHAENDSLGPIYMHCWNGWHASGLLSALSFRQFCGIDGQTAADYWDLGTDGANKSPRYEKIRQQIKDFEPYPDLFIDSENWICAEIPLDGASSKLQTVAHLNVVYESLSKGDLLLMPSLNFDPGNHELSDVENEDLQELLKAMRSHPDLEIEIQGHTDATGKEEKNRILSEKRARSVYNFLVKNDVNPKRVSYTGFGSKKPRYYQNTEKNRRIEVKIISKKKEDNSTLVNPDEN